VVAAAPLPPTPAPAPEPPPPPPPPIVAAPPPQPPVPPVASSPVAPPSFAPVPPQPQPQPPIPAPPSASFANVPAEPPRAPVDNVPPASVYARPADVPADPRTPPVQMVDNRPVVSPSFLATQAPAPAPVTNVPAPVASSAPLDPLRTMAAPLPPAMAATAPQRMAPVDSARAENVTVRQTQPPPLTPPAAPTDVAQIPNQPPQPAPYQQPYQPLPQAAALPRQTPGLDEALRREFAPSATQPVLPPPLPPVAPSRPFGGVDALAATIYFADGSSGLVEDDRTILREVARMYRERGGGVRVVGFASPVARGADTVARRVANLEISAKRADAVSRELSRFGVPPAAITASAEGGDNGPGSTGRGSGGFGAAGERRVDIYLDY
jgi:outer membrane protein OmpA-like peptidoglycan-associated protein